MFEISCVVSGSFPKAKDRIDNAIGVFERGGIRVLSPTKGGLFNPAPSQFWTPGSYPLANERHISERQAKSGHIAAIRKANFIYFVVPNGYLGLSGATEAGIAYGANIPLYSDEPIDPTLDGGHWEEHVKVFQVTSPEEVVEIWKDRKNPIPGLLLPRWYAFELYEQNQPTN
jgi:hypothetical protein